MNIIEAVQTGKKFRRPCWDKDVYIYPDQTVIDGLSKDDLLATDYELYTPEIRPKEAGELWEFIGDDGMKSDLFILQDEDGNLSFIDECGNKDEIPQEMSHNYYDISNGTYFRVKPPVEDCERVEIELPHGTIALADLFSQIMTEGKRGKLIFIPKKKEG